VQSLGLGKSLRLWLVVFCTEWQQVWTGGGWQLEGEAAGLRMAEEAVPWGTLCCCRSAGMILGLEGDALTVGVDPQMCGHG